MMAQSMSKFTVVVVLLGIVLSVAIFRPEISPVPSKPIPTPTPVPDILAIRAELDALYTEVTAIEHRIDSISQVPPEISISSELAQIRSNSDAVSSRLDVIDWTLDK